MEEIRTMIADSWQLQEAGEPGQAFDKLARGIEAAMRAVHPQGTQRPKAFALFELCLQDPAVWAAIQASAPGLRRFVEEFTSYLAHADEDASKKLRDAVQEIGVATQTGDRGVAVRGLTELFFTMRNKRFHGHPEFSGRNIRVTHWAPALLDTYRAILKGHVGDAGPSSS